MSKSGTSRPSILLAVAAVLAAAAVWAAVAMASGGSGSSGAGSTGLSPPASSFVDPNAAYAATGQPPHRRGDCPNMGGDNGSGGSTTPSTPSAPSTPSTQDGSSNPTL